MRTTWDIFCAVIDNYGDIGVSWRLARQLVNEQNLAVRLWVDDLDTFCRLCPEADSDVAVQQVQGVSLYHWLPDCQPVGVADVVIEAFACHLPAAYIDAMAQCASPPLWLNLEYLSAEDWVEGCHALPSLQANGLQKYFFFPGFSPRTGGLLRESGLIEQRHRFQQDSVAPQKFLQSIGVSIETDACVISLFCYETPNLSRWLEALTRSTQAVHLLVPEGKILSELKAWLGQSRLVAGDVHRRGALTVQILPFLSQPDYDRLLWSCALNIVRGEDSFVRAQWAGRPFIWHIYPQREDAHRLKLDAFFKLYSRGLSPEACHTLRTHWLAWNAGEAEASWQTLQTALPALTLHAENWCQQLAEQTNISTALVQSHRNWLKYATLNTQ